MTTMLLYQNENLLIDFHYSIHPIKNEDGSISQINTDSWFVFSVMLNGRLKRVNYVLDIQITQGPLNATGMEFVGLEDEDGKPYGVYANFRNIETILDVFSQIGYDVDKQAIYKKMMEYVEGKTFNYLNPQYQKPLPQ